MGHIYFDILEVPQHGFHQVPGYQSSNELLWLDKDECFNMGIPIPGEEGLYIDSEPRRHGPLVAWNRSFQNIWNLDFDWPSVVCQLIKIQVWKFVLTNMDLPWILLS